MFDPQTVHLIDTTSSRRYSNHYTLHLRYVTHDPPATQKTLPNPRSRVTPPCYLKDPTQTSHRHTLYELQKGQASRLSVWIRQVYIAGHSGRKTDHKDAPNVGCT